MSMMCYIKMVLKVLDFAGLFGFPLKLLTLHHSVKWYFISFQFFLSFLVDIPELVGFKYRFIWFKWKLKRKGSKIVLPTMVETKLKLMDLFFL